MAEETKYKSVRINFRDEADYETFRRWETVLILTGVDFSEEISKVLGQELRANLKYYRGISEGREPDFDMICDSNQLRNRIVGLFDRDVSRGELQKIREKVLERGVDFFEGTSGGNKVFRYDAGLCLPKIRKYLGKE